VGFPDKESYTYIKVDDREKFNQNFNIWKKMMEGNDEDEGNLVRSSKKLAASVVRVEE
jgi:hypothetical protein